MPDTDSQKTVFISYRRSTSSYVARAIFNDLRLNGYDVFMDVESIDNGAFDTVIVNQIKARAHFLIICTPGTFENCDQPGDWLRREVETAMDCGRNIVPILANDFKFEQNRRYLTGRLAGLPGLNGLLLVHEYFDAGMEKLRNRYLRQPTAGAIMPAPRADLSAVNQKIQQAAAQPAPTPEELTAEEYFNRGCAQPDDDLDGKIAHYTEAIRLNPAYAEAYNNRGIAYRDQSNFDAAVADYSESIRLNPNHAKTYYNRGIARRHLGDFDGAIADYSEAIHLNPEYADAYYNRGIARRYKGDLDGAIADYGEAIRLNAQDVEAHNSRRHVHFDQGDFDAAIADYDEAIRLDPNNASIYNNRGNGWYARGDLDRAIADYSEAIRLDPDDGGARNNRAAARYISGELTEALEDANQALELEAKSNRYGTRGKIHFALGEYGGALADFEASRKRAPDSRSAVAGLAIALHALGRIDKAQFHWRALIAADPRCRDADWVGKELEWRPELVAEARKLIASLDA